MEVCHHQKNKSQQSEITNLSEWRKSSFLFVPRTRQCFDVTTWVFVFFLGGEGHGNFFSISDSELLNRLLAWGMILLRLLRLLLLVSFSFSFSFSSFSFFLLYHWNNRRPDLKLRNEMWMISFLIFVNVVRGKRTSEYQLIRYGSFDMQTRKNQTKLKKKHCYGFFRI